MPGFLDRNNLLFMLHTFELSSCVLLTEVYSRTFRHIGLKNRSSKRTHLTSSESIHLIHWNYSSFECISFCHSHRIFFFADFVKSIRRSDKIGSRICLHRFSFFSPSLFPIFSDFTIITRFREIWIFLFCMLFYSFELSTI